MFLIQNGRHSVSTCIATEELVITLGLLNLANFLLSCPVRAERILSRGGSEIFFNLGEDRQNQFFTNIISVLPKFRGGSILLGFALTDPVLFETDILLSSFICN